MTETNLPNLSVADVDPTPAKPAGGAVTPNQRIRPDKVVNEDGVLVYAGTGTPLNEDQKAERHAAEETLRTNLEAVGPGNTLINPIA